MIAGIGCDIVKVARVEKLMKQFGQKFLKRIFTASEIANAPMNESKMVSYYSKRFAAKEAFAKALGTGIGIIAFNEIEIYNDASGKPDIRILKNLPPPHKAGKIHLTLSDEDGMALAFVVLEQ